MTGRIKLNFSGRDCTDKSVSLVTTGSVGTVTAAFGFDAEWEGFARTAIFASGGTVKRVVLDDANACVVPWEVLTNCKQLTIGVVGTSGNRVLPSVPVTIPIIEGVCNGGTPPDDPTPDIYAQLLDLAKETQQIAQSVRDDANAGKFNGAPGAKGDPGADGKTPVKGVDYWTPTEAAEIDAAKTAANNAADNASVAEAAALNAASMADEAASSASISAQNADAAAGEARDKAAELQAKADAGDFNGQDGYTPVRGTDYWTDADKAAINADIAAQVAGKVDKIDGKGLSTNDYTDADKAAVVLLGKNVTLLKEITTTEEASVIVLLDNVKIRNFFVEAEIAKAAANTAGQLILSYTDGSSVYCTIANSFNSARANKSSYIGYDIHGMQPILCRNQSTSGISGTYAALSSFHYGNNAASKIRYHSVDSTVVPVGSKFTVYGILEE